MSTDIFEKRLQHNMDELHWLYMELYYDENMFQKLCVILRTFYKKRSGSLKSLDLKRSLHPNWYQNLTGIRLYLDNYAENTDEMRKRLDYIDTYNINFLHLLLFPKKAIPSPDELHALTKACHFRNISVCMDVDMNATSNSHEWARHARSGHSKYQNYYYFLENNSILQQLNQTLPDTFTQEHFTLIPEVQRYVMTSQGTDSWDLNYRNPEVFHAMIMQILKLVNSGVDIVHLKNLPFIWKELGTSCQNLRPVHTIVRLIRIICEIVCPGVLLLGSIQGITNEEIAYFGTSRRPECHLLYFKNLVPNIWHTVATRNIHLLKQQLDCLNHLPKDHLLLQALHSQDAISWNLDSEMLLQDNMHIVPHKKYLNTYFLGQTGFSKSQGQLCPLGPKENQIGFCGTTASMCGIETALKQKDTDILAKALQLDITLHAFLFMCPGIPVLYNGDEMLQLNDWAYTEDPERAADPESIHRGRISWDNLQKINDSHSIENKFFLTLKSLGKIRDQEAAFSPNADFWTIETWTPEILCTARSYKSEKVIGLFNFSEHDRIAWINERDGEYEDLMTGQTISAIGLQVPAYSFYYLKKKLGS